MAAIHELIGLPTSDVPELGIADLRWLFAHRMQAERDQGALRYLTGDITPFPGYDYASLSRKIILSAEFDERSAQEIATKVSQPLSEIAQANGITIAIPGKSLLPSHTTIQIINYASEAEMQQNLDRINGQLIDSTKYLQGIHIPFNQLVLNGTRMFIGSSNPLQSFESSNAYSGIQQSRWAVRNLHFGEGTLQTDEDILHSSVGRITQVNNPRYISFLRQVNAFLAPTLQASPLRARVNSVFVGSCVEQVKGVNPQLFAKNNIVTANMSRRIA